VVPLVNVLVAAGMLAVVPTGLALVGGVPLWLRRAWPVGAAAGAASLWLPRGGLATALAAAYLAVALALAGWAPSRLTGARWSRTAIGAAVLTALACPLVAAVALVAERSGHELFGFGLTILRLTVPHFHYAGFAAALISALVSRAARPGPLATAAAWCVPAGTAAVFAGYFAGDAAELAGAVILTAGMWITGWLTWHHIRPAARRLAKPLFGTAAAVLAVTMALALDYAAGEALGVPHLSLTWMAATHGVLNAAGFTVCALVAWRLTTTEKL
jgi:hypothetical protein